MNSPVRLGVSPAAVSTPTGVFSQWFETISVYWNFGLQGLSPCLPAAASPASCSFAHPTPQSPASLGPPAAALPRVLSAQLPVSAPPTGLDECFFFISLVVRLPYSTIFCQLWFLFLNCCCPSFGCGRRHSVSTYASILAGSLDPFSFFCCLP